MADVKISALPAGATPVANADLVPVVQGSTTRRVTVDQLTVGRVITYSAANVSTFIALGGNPSATGNVRLSPLGSMEWRKADGTAGQGSFVVQDAGGNLVYSTPTGWHRLYCGATEIASVRPNGVVLGTAGIVVTVPGALTIGTNPAQSGALRLANATFMFGRNAGNTTDIPMIGVNAANYVQIGNVTNPVQVLSHVAFGTNPANAGSIRLPNNQNIYARNVGNTADVLLVSCSSIDQVQLGNAQASGTALNAGAAGTHVFNVGGAQQIQVSSGALALKDDFYIIGGSTVGLRLGSAATQKLGFYGAAPVVRPTLPAAATDPATTMALVNAIRTNLIALGLMQ